MRKRIVTIIMITVCVLLAVLTGWFSVNLRKARKQLSVYENELFRMNESQLAKEVRPFYPSAVNTVLGHEERESIIGNFRGDTIDRLTVVPRFKHEYIEEEPYSEFFLDGKQISEEYYTEEAQYLWRVVSYYKTVPSMDVFGYHPHLVFEGDLDQNGTQEFGILDTWESSGCRNYRVYTYRDGVWRLLVDPIGTAVSLRSSGKEIACPGPRPGTVSVTMSDFSAPQSSCNWAPDIDTVLAAVFLPVEQIKN